VAEIKLLVHARDRRLAQQEARRSGVRLAEMVWCQDPQGIRGLSLSHLKNMRQTHPTDCSSLLCDETRARLRAIGWE
jgi:hypothetical protein